MGLADLYREYGCHNVIKVTKVAISKVGRKTGPVSPKI